MAVLTNKPLRVLLISPVPDLDPPNGDVVYTQGLLRHPPPNVQYETYPEAMAAGRLRELGRRSEYHDASGRERLHALVRIGRERTINALRRRGALFREPFRFFSVQKHAYDLVHCHVFSAAFPNLGVPLVVSNACVIEEVYRGVSGWSRSRVEMASKADAALASFLRVQHTSHAMPTAAAVVCFTNHLRAELVRRGACQPSRLHVAPCFVERGPRPLADGRPRTIGFVAGDFNAKGGPAVLEAFRLIRRQRADVELIVVGSPPQGDLRQLRENGITWHPRVSRTELLDRHLPSMDVFAYPTRFDGLPLTVLEAMARGIPVATSDYGPMPEIVGHGAAGSVTPLGDVPALAQAVLELLDPQKNAEARRRAASWFDANYTPGIAVGRLAAAYDAAVAVGSSCSS